MSARRARPVPRSPPQVDDANAEGDFDRAWDLHTQAMTIRRQLGDPRALAYGRTFLAEALRNLGEGEAVKRLLDERLAAFRELGDRRGITLALHSLAGVAHDSGNHARAAARYREARLLRRELGHRRDLAEGLEGVATSGTGRSVRVARLLGAAAALREGLGAPLLTADRDRLDRAAAAVRAALGDDAFAMGYAAGQAPPPDEAVTEALVVASRPGRKRSRRAKSAG